MYSLYLFSSFVPFFYIKIIIIIIINNNVTRTIDNHLLYIIITSNLQVKYKARLGLPILSQLIGWIAIQLGLATRFVNDY